MRGGLVKGDGMGASARLGVEGDKQIGEVRGCRARLREQRLEDSHVFEFEHAHGEQGSQRIENLIAGIAIGTFQNPDGFEGDQ